MRNTQLKSIFDRYKQSLKGLLSAGVLVDNKDLSKIHVSGKPFRYLLAFFVPKFCPASQAGQTDSTAQTLFTGLNRHIYKRAFRANISQRNVTSYGGVTLQNIKAYWRICRAVADVTESEPRHPMTFHSVVLTQNNTSGGNHA